MKLMRTNDKYNVTKHYANGRRVSKVKWHELWQENKENNPKVTMSRDKAGRIILVSETKVMKRKTWRTTYEEAYAEGTITIVSMQQASAWEYEYASHLRENGRYSSYDLILARHAQKKAAMLSALVRKWMGIANKA